jgi:hypothetical protein
VWINSYTYINENLKTEGVFMTPYINVLKSLIFICCAAPWISFAADNEPVDTEAAENSCEEKEANCGFGAPGGPMFDQFSNIYLPVSAHVVSQVSALGDEIRFDDGSAWKVSPYDCSQAIQWLDYNTPVSVMQNTSWFSSYNFRIMNKATGVSIVANLFQGPWKGGEKSHYVTEFDFHQGTVKLSNATEVTRWEIHPSDLYRFREWNFNDTIPVIVGQNADYDPSWNPQWEGLLINVRKTKSFVRAHQY